MGPGAKKATETPRFVTWSSAVAFLFMAALLVTGVMGVRAKERDMEFVVFLGAMGVVICVTSLISAIRWRRENLRERWLEISKKRWRRQHPHPYRD